MTNLKYTDLLKPEEITVWKCWEVFSRSVLPNIEPESIQYIEMRKVFYIGFLECFKIMNDLSVSISEEQAAHFLSRINQECHDFFEKELRPHIKEFKGIS